MPMISQLRSKGSRLNRLLVENARRPWNDDLQYALLDFLGALKAVIDQNDWETDGVFWLALIRQDMTRPYVPEEPRPEDIPGVMEMLHETVTNMSIDRGRTPDRHGITRAFCEALKATSYLVPR